MLGITILPCTILDVFAAVVRIAAAVHEVVGPALETIEKDMMNIQSFISMRATFSTFDKKCLRRSNNM